MKASTKQNSDRIFGMGLVIVGSLVLLNQFVTLPPMLEALDGLIFLFGLGLAFILTGISSKNSGFLIPGGIISGIATGVAIGDFPIFEQLLGANGADSLFFFAFAAGWLSIPILSKLFTADRHGWALIPATIFIMIGLGHVLGEVIWSMIGSVLRLWPLLLIILGISIIREQTASK